MDSDMDSSITDKRLYITKLYKTLNKQFLKKYARKRIKIILSIPDVTGS